MARIKATNKKRFKARFKALKSKRKCITKENKRNAKKNAKENKAKIISAFNSEIKEYLQSEKPEELHEINEDFIQGVKLYNRLNGKARWLKLKITNLFQRKPPNLTALGSYLITGYPGAGKNLLLSYLINKVEEIYPGKYFWYCSVPGEYNQKNVFGFNMKDIFDDKEQISRFPLKKGNRVLYGVIFDEINREFNRRDNTTTRYKERFLGFSEFLVTHRHQGVPRVYMIGQKKELQDTQIISLAKMQLDIIHTRRRNTYSFYKKTGTTNKIPVLLKIKLFKKDWNDQYAPAGLVKIKPRTKDLLSYNSLALAEKYSKLPAVPAITIDKK